MLSDSFWIAKQMALWFCQSLIRQDFLQYLVALQPPHTKNFSVDSVLKQPLQWWDSLSTIWSATGCPLAVAEGSFPVAEDSYRQNVWHPHISSNPCSCLLLPYQGMPYSNDTFSYMLPFLLLFLSVLTALVSDREAEGWLAGLSLPILHDTAWLSTFETLAFPFWPIPSFEFLSASSAKAVFNWEISSASVTPGFIRKERILDLIVLLKRSVSIVWRKRFWHCVLSYFSSVFSCSDAKTIFSRKVRALSKKFWGSSVGNWTKFARLPNSSDADFS